MLYGHRSRRERAHSSTTLTNMGKLLTSEQSKYRGTTWQVVISYAGSFCGCQEVNQKDKEIWHAQTLNFKIAGMVFNQERTRRLESGRGKNAKQSRYCTFCPHPLMALRANQLEISKTIKIKLELPNCSLMTVQQRI